jgi:hypothetical protein
LPKTDEGTMDAPLAPRPKPNRPGKPSKEAPAKEQRPSEKGELPRESSDRAADPSRLDRTTPPSDAIHSLAEVLLAKTNPRLIQIQEDAVLDLVDGHAATGAWSEISRPGYALDKAVEDSLLAVPNEVGEHPYLALFAAGMLVEEFSRPLHRVRSRPDQR